MSKDIERRKAGRSSEVGFLVAAATVPRSFQKSLQPRSTPDQGIITGLLMLSGFTLASVIQSVIDAFAGKISRSANDSKATLNQDDYSIFTSLIAFSSGMSGQKIFEEKENEKLPRSAARVVSYWISVVGFAGVVAGLLEKLVVGASEAGTKGESQKRRNILLPLVVPTGALITYSYDHLKQRKETVVASDTQETKDLFDTANPVKALGISIGVAATLGLLSFGERFAAKKIDEVVEDRAPALKNAWLPIGQVVALGTIGFGMYEGIRRLYRKIENGNNQFEKHYHKIPQLNEVSGSAKSLVNWQTLSLQGRRHIGEVVTKEKINKAMGTQNALQPIRIYIGFESALTEKERVELAIAELHRTGAFDRAHLVIVSPTGTGYVNYVFSETVEYMSLGNCASITIQYSLRPSPLSLDQVPEGRDHFRMLINRVHQELKNRPKNKRPKLSLFGESLGAWTSQDAFVNTGTYMLDALDIAASFWIGTPAGSKWAAQVLHEDRYDTDKSLIGEFNDFGQFKSLSTKEKNALRYVMVTHDDDPIPKFGGTLLLKEPTWLKKENRMKTPTVPNDMQWNSPRTFIHMLVDMKNALKPIPGQFVSVGHDYRADIADFVEAIFKFNITKTQRVSVDKALREADKLRGKTQG